MKKKIIILLLIIICIIYINIQYHNKHNNILNTLYKYPISKNNIYKDYIYDIYANHINIISYNGNSKVVEIPSIIKDKPVISIEDSAFYGNAYIEKIIIPSTIIKIGYQSFIGCQNLKEISIPKSILYIGESAFDNCPNLKYIYIEQNSKTEKLLIKKNYRTYIKYK